MPIITTLEGPTLPCVNIGDLPVGYYLTWAAIWNTVTVQSCSLSAELVTLQVTETNVATGSVDYDVTWTPILSTTSVLAVTPPAR